MSWWTGRHFGPGAADWLIRHHPGSKRSVDRCERFIDRYGIVSVMLAPWLPLPTVLMHAANGGRRMPLPVFIVTDIIGTTLRAAVMARGRAASGVAQAGPEQGQILVSEAVAGQPPVEAAVPDV